MWLPVVYNEVHASRPAVQPKRGPLHFSPLCGFSVVSAFTEIVFSIVPLSAHVQNSDIWFLMHQPNDQFKQFCNISACTEVLIYYISQMASF